MRKIVREAKLHLERHGFDVQELENLLFITREKKVNPADVRTMVAEVLHLGGFKDYYLKEVYAYQASKKPWRTDTEAYVELEARGEFDRGAPPIHLATTTKELTHA